MLKTMTFLWSKGTTCVIAMHLKFNSFATSLPEKENRPFSAHLTLGRVKDVNGIQPVLEKLKNYQDIELGSFDVTSFYLIKSELHRTGSIYTSLKKIDLKK